MSARHQALLAAVTSSAKKPAETAAKPKKKLKKLQPRDPKMHVNEPQALQDLELGDLLEPLEGNKQAVQASAVKQQVKELLRDKKSQALALPMHVGEKHRIARKANYKVAGEQARQWLPQLDKLEHQAQLDFTQQEPNLRVSLNSMAASMGKKEEGRVEQMREEIGEALKAQGLDDEETRVKFQEEQLGRTLTAEEVQQRMGELARMKHLLFKEEAKRKRVAKIKSKLYHKLKRKAKERTQSNLLSQLDKIDPEAAENYRLQMEERRAEERVRMRHATTSRFARQLMRYGKKEQKETRDAYHEMVRKREELQRKVQSVRGRSVLKDDDDQEVLSFFSDQIEQEQAALQEELKQLEPEIEGGEGAGSALFDPNKDKLGFAEPPMQKKKRTAGKGVMGMRFMQKAMEQEQAETKEQVKSLKQKLKEQEEMEEDGEYDEEEEKTQQLVKREKGRHQGQGKQSGKASKQLIRQIQKGELKKKEKEEKKQKKKQEVIVQSESSSEDEEAELEEELERTREMKKGGLQLQEAVGQLEAEEQEEQDELETDLMRRVFVGGGSNATEFVQNKELELERAAAGDGKNDKLRGWGEWAGESIKPKAQDTEQLIAKRRAKLAEMRAARRDGGLRKVQLSERRDKKFKKYQTQEVPFGFSGQRQFEALMNVPLGKEWNTMSSYKRLIQPSVLSKAGQVIGALKHRKVLPLAAIDTLVAQRKDTSRPAAKF